jgi:hypothetical protein
LAIEALAKAHSGSFTAISQALGYLLQRQNLDGSYSLGNLAAGAPYPTAAALIALQQYRLSFNLANPIAGAVRSLISAQAMSGGWGSDWETALALLALGPATTDVAPFFLGIQVLDAAQLSDGSWGQDVYSTALAARALWVLQSSPSVPPPGNGLLAGQVVDSGSGLPLGGVQVTVGTALSATTDPTGMFRLSEVPPGAYTVAYAAAGYADASQTVALSAGQQADLGTIRLTALPTTGIVTGTVTDSGHGQPIAGAQVTLTGAGNAAAVTDSSGAYRLAAPPGPVTITASATGFLTATGSATLQAGQTLNFSPGLLATAGLPPDYQPPTTVILTGAVVDALTGQPLSGVSVSVTGGTLQSSTDPAGRFSLADLPPGELALDVALAGYQGVHVSLTAPAGTADLGTIRLSPAADSELTTSVAGVVTDSGTGTPLAGASVAIEGLGKGTLTGTDGTYRIEGITQNSFTVTVSAVGYLSGRGDVTLTQPSLVTFDAALDRASAADFDIAELVAEAPSYPAHSEVEVEVQLVNGAATERQVRLYVVVVDDQNLIVEQFPAKIVPMGGDPATALETVPAGGAQAAEVEWYNGARAPGRYDLIVQAYDAASGRLLAERSTPVELLATRAIGGSVTFDPPITQLASQQPVHLTAQVANRGNLDLAGGTATAKVTLKNPGYQATNPAMEVQTLIQGNGLSYPKGIDRDSAGNIYAVNYNAGTLNRIDPVAGTLFRLGAGNVLETVQANLPILETFAISPNGTLAALYGSNKLALISPSGARREMSNTLPSGIQGIVWEAEDRIAVSIYGTHTLLRLYLPALLNEVAVGEVTYTRTVPLPPLGLADPAVALDFGSWTPMASGDFQVELSVDAHPEFGALYNTLHVGPNAHGVMTVAQPVVRPGDRANQATVTLFGADSTSITQIDPNGTTLAAASKTSGGRGIAADTDGNIYVVDTSRIVRITPNRNVETFVSGYSFGTGLAIDAHNNLYAYVANTATVLKIAPNKIITSLATLDGMIRGLAVGYDDRLYAVDSSNSLSRIYLDKPEFGIRKREMGTRLFA